MTKRTEMTSTRTTRATCATRATCMTRTKCTTRSTRTTVKGSPEVKSRTRKRKVTPEEEAASDTVSLGATRRSNARSRNDFSLIQDSPQSPVASTPRGKRQTRQARDSCLTSTPVHSSFTDRVPQILDSPPEAKQETLDCTTVSTPLKRSERGSPRSASASRTRRKGCRDPPPRQVTTRQTKEKTQACSEAGRPPAKGRRGRKRKKMAANTAQSLSRSRPRFNLEKPEEAEQEDVSSELSIELSHHEEQLLSLSFQEDEETDEEDEELPSFLMAKKPPSITEGVFVWHKFRSYPFWPALVKSVYRKQKKASVLFIDDSILQKTRGFTVPLRSLKPFYTEEANELVCKAKEQYEADIEWALELISHYRISIACGSFSGSFTEYLAHDMSFPVRSKDRRAASERLTIGSDETMELLSDDLKEESIVKPQEEVSRCSKRLLPDRSHAAHNRANEKLVHFIVKQRKVDEHLLAVIHGQQESRWYHSFLSASRRRVVNIYLEDDHQLDQVYWYLNELYMTAVASAPCRTKLKSMEQVPFVLDVLLPEAIISAIAGVDKVSVEEAEEKYLKGRRISNRERQEFDLMIERHMMTKSLPSNTNKHL